MAPRTKSRGAKGRSRTTKKRPTKKPRRGLVAALRAMKDRVRERLGRQTDDVWGVVLIVCAMLLVLALLGLAGPGGGVVVQSLEFLFGVWAWFVPVILAVVGIAIVGTMPRADYARMSVGLVTVFVGSLALFHLMTGTLSLAESMDRVVERGGAVGSLVAFPLRRLIGFWGTFVVLLAVLGVGALVVTKATIRDVWHTVVDALRWLKAPFTDRDRRPAPAPVEVVAAKPKAQRGPSIPETEPAKKAPKKSKPEQPPRPKVPPAPRGDGYELPPIDLLTSSETSGHNRRALEAAGAELEETLHQHGVDARLVRIVPGPTVTRFEIELEPGVKVSRVTGMAHDIAYAMASADVRILAPIPGKSAIGIEVPNRHRSLVTLGDILGSAEAQADPDPVTVGLGKDISGRPRMLKLDELPHVLIAGATGAGKSSCINALVTSILMRARPDEVRLILVDPKRVELGQYNSVPHLLTRVITNPKKAADALQWAVQEMDRRYELLADAGVRDIISYREKWDAGGLDPDGFDRFPFIVVIVDELNDLMMVAGRAVEDSVVRIAQMARAVGIHLVLATQRPSVNVITGVIKANVPSRLAFSVTSQTDSRVILDSSGAEKLVGLGDMLVVTARDPKPERIQGAFVSEGEVHAVVDWVKKQREARYKDKEVFEPAKQAAAVEEEFEGEDPEIVTQAIELVVRSQLGSTSMLQRKLRIGFARAGRVMDILERKGIVGPSEGSKARSVLVTEEELGSLVGSTDG
jgi:S-DNA-T family DNA segregation ATPase FtsK/SpoIIIE